MTPLKDIKSDLVYFLKNMGIDDEFIFTGVAEFRTILTRYENFELTINIFGDNLSYKNKLYYEPGKYHFKFSINTTISPKYQSYYSDIYTEDFLDKMKDEIMDKILFFGVNKKVCRRIIFNNLGI